MSVFRYAGEFILFNFLTLSIIAVSTVLFIYFAQKVYRELRFNKRLKLFQAMRRGVPLKMRSKRIAVSMVMVALPVVILVSFLQVSIPPSLQYDHYRTNITSANDMMQIYEHHMARTEAFDGASITEAERMPLLPISHQSAHHPAREDAMPRQQLDVVKVDQNFLYVLNTDRLSIIDIKADMWDQDNEASVHKTIHFNGNDTERFEPVEFYLEDNLVIVVGKIVEPPNIGMTSFESSSRQGDAALVKVFDANQNFERVETYRINGDLDTTIKNGRRVLLTLKQPIDFHETSELNDLLPRVINSSQTFASDYDDLIYIEGTKPNGLLTFVSIDVVNGDVDKSVFFGDLRSVVHTAGSSIYIVANSHRFKDSTDMFVVPEPILETRTAVTRLSHNSSGIHYRATEMAPGTLWQSNAIHEHAGRFRIITQIVNGDEIAYRLNIFDNRMVLKRSISDIAQASATLEFVRFYQQFVYVGSSDDDTPLHVVDTADLDNIDITPHEPMNGFSTILHHISDDKIIGIGFFNAPNSRAIGGITLSMYDASDKDYPTVVATETIAFKSHETSDLIDSPKAYYYCHVYNRIIIPINAARWNHDQVNPARLEIYEVMDDSFRHDYTLMHAFDTRQYNRYRGVVIEDTFYSVSTGYVRIAGMEDLSEPLQIISLYEDE